MKHIKLYLTALLFASLGLASCEDNWDTPPLDGPVATIEANTTILELKAKYWTEEANSADTIKTKENGDHYIIKGRVISSDAAGNIYKKLVIQDETAALTLSIDANSLYNSYRPGQEIVIDATDMYIGKYAALQQMGLPEYSEQFGWQMTRMPLEMMQAHTQLNGLPEPEKMDTIETTISALPTDKEGIIKMQSQLVRFDNVQFENGGKATFAVYQQNTSQNINDGTASLTVRTSGYANFYNKTLPEGVGSVVGILSYFNSTWQLELRSYEDCIFGETLPGSKTNPFTVDQAIEGQTKQSGWVKGYIVGAVAGGVTDVTGNNDIEWNAPFSLPNTLIIAASAGERDFTKCLAIELPQGSALRTKANLADNPDNLGSEIMLKGSFDKVLGMAGITKNTGAADEFVFNAVVTLTQLEQNFDGFKSQANDKGWIDLSASNLLGEGWTTAYAKGDKQWSMRNFSENVYATFSGYNGKAPFDAWLITPMFNIDKMAEKVMSFKSQVNGYGSKTSKFEVYVMSSADPTKAELTLLKANLPEAPASGYSDWVMSGNIDLSGFSGKVYIGFRYTAESDANYATWCFDDLKIGIRGEGGNVTDNDGSEAKPYTVADVLGGINAGTDKWVKGYIVGFIGGVDAKTASKFTAEGANDLTLLLADAADVKDATQCISVALPADKRAELGLKSKPENLGKAVALKGNLTAVKYGIPGIEMISAFKF